MSTLYKIILVFVASVSAEMCNDSIVYSFESDSISIKKTETHCDIEYWELSKEKSEIELELSFYSEHIPYSEKDTMYLVNSRERRLCNISSDTTRFNQQSGLVEFSGTSGGSGCSKHSVLFTSSRVISFKGQSLLFKSNFLHLLSFDTAKNEAEFRVEICYEYGKIHDCERKVLKIDPSKEVMFETQKGSKLLIRLKHKGIKSDL